MKFEGNIIFQGKIKISTKQKNKCMFIYDKLIITDKANVYYNTYKLESSYVNDTSDFKKIKKNLKNKELTAIINNYDLSQVHLEYIDNFVAQEHSFEQLRHYIQEIISTSNTEKLSKQTVYLIDNNYIEQKSSNDECEDYICIECGNLIVDTGGFNPCGHTGYCWICIGGKESRDCHKCGKTIKGFYNIDEWNPGRHPSRHLSRFDDV